MITGVMMFNCKRGGLFDRKEEINVGLRVLCFIILYYATKNYPSLTFQTVPQIFNDTKYSLPGKSITPSDFVVFKIIERICPVAKQSLSSKGSSILMLR